MEPVIKIAAGVLALVVVGPLMAANGKSNEAASILSRIESNIDDIHTQSDRLMTYNRAPDQYDWQLHASELNRIKSEAGVIADLMKEFNGIKADATHRQRYAFDQVVNLMAKVSDSTEGAIKVVNDDKGKIEVAHPDYAAKVEAIFDSSGEALDQLDVAESWFELQDSWKSE